MFQKKLIDVLILIEHKARELETATLMSYYFKERGFSCEIQSIKYHKEFIISQYKPKIVVVPWAYSNKEMELYSIFNQDKKLPKTLIVNMHHEQLSNEDSDEFIIPKDDAINTIHISWGENFTKKLLAANCQKNSIIQSGNPKLDFYKNNLQKLSKSRKELFLKYGIDPSKKWVLFIANSFHLLTNEQIKVNIDKGVDILEQIKSSRENRDEFLKYVKEYLSENNDTIFIYRPHPSFAHLDRETPEITELEEQYPNFKCISENSIRDWIINVDLAMSFHSTSIIECVVAKTPYYLFRTTPLSHNKDYNFFVNYNHKIKNYYDFNAVIKNHNKFSYKKFVRDIESKIDLNESEYSSKIIVDKIINFYNDDIILYGKKYNKISEIKFNFLIIIKKFLQTIGEIKIIKKLLLMKNDLRFYNLFFEGDDYFSKKEVEILEKDIKNVIENQLN